MSNNGIRSKDIFAIINDITNRYIHKIDVYNAISRVRQQKLNGLNEIQMLLKTLANDSDVIAKISAKNPIGTFLPILY